MCGCGRGRKECAQFGDILNVSEYVISSKYIALKKEKGEFFSSFPSAMKF
jgi:DUF438 domain-containing protein